MSFFVLFFATKAQRREVALMVSVLFFVSSCLCGSFVFISLINE
jgi:hypothetical protein